MSQRFAAPTGEPLPGSDGGPPVQPFQGLTAVGLMLVILIAYVLSKIQFVLVLFLLAVLFATIIERPVTLLERRRFPRAASILIVYVAVIGTITLGAILVAPGISEEARIFREEAPTQIRELQVRWAADDSGIKNNAARFLGQVVNLIENPSAPSGEVAFSVVTSLGGGFVGLFTGLIVAFYYLMEKQFLRRIILLQIRPGSRERVNRVWEEVEAKVGRWMRGQLTLCLVIGTLSLIGYGAMGIRFWPILGIWAGITEAIPIIGPWLGGIPAVIVAMTMSWDKALLAIGFVVALQFLENAVLVPRVMRGAVGLSPLTVFIAILAGTELMGIAGSLLAIPVAAAVQVILSDYLRARQSIAGDQTEHARWRWMRGMRPDATSPTVLAAPTFTPTEDSGDWAEKALTKTAGPEQPGQTSGT